MKSNLETKLDQGGWCGSVLHRHPVRERYPMSKYLGEELAANKAQATQFGRWGGPYEEPPEKLFWDSMHLERRDSSLGKCVGFKSQQSVFNGRFNKTDWSTSTQPSMQSEHYILILLCIFLLLQLYSPPNIWGQLDLLLTESEMNTWRLNNFFIFNV